MFGLRRTRPVRNARVSSLRNAASRLVARLTYGLVHQMACSLTGSSNARGWQTCPGLQCCSNRPARSCRSGSGRGGSRAAHHRIGADERSGDSMPLRGRPPYARATAPSPERWWHRTRHVIQLREKHRGSGALTHSVSTLPAHLCGGRLTDLEAGKGKPPAPAIHHDRCCPHLSHQQSPGNPHQPPARPRPPARAIAGGQR